MKTLDEVIKANECCDHGEPDSRCEDCPYNGIGACCAERETDALHYLKEYRSDKAQWEANRKAWDLFEEDLVNARMKYIAKLKELEIGTLNPPLTWEQLKQMEGKPVWVEGSHGPALSYKGWALISFDRQGDNMKCQLYNSAEFWIGEEDYGTDWQAFRKELS